MAVVHACRSWKMSCGYGPYVALMQKYPLVTDAFLRLAPSYQKVGYLMPAIMPWASPYVPQCYPGTHTLHC